MDHDAIRPQKPGQMARRADWLREEKTTEESNERNEMKLQAKALQLPQTSSSRVCSPYAPARTGFDRVDPAGLISSDNHPQWPPKGIMFAWFGSEGGLARQNKRPHSRFMIQQVDNNRPMPSQRRDFQAITH